MNIGLAFWILMLVWFCFGWYARPSGGGIKAVGGDILVFVLLAIVGWQLFGAPLHK